MALHESLWNHPQHSNEAIVQAARSRSAARTVQVVVAGARTGARTECLVNLINYGDASQEHPGNAELAYFAEYYCGGTIYALDIIHLPPPTALYSAMLCRSPHCALVLAYDAAHPTSYRHAQNQISVVMESFTAHKSRLRFPVLLLELNTPQPHGSAEAAASALSTPTAEGRTFAYDRGCMFATCNATVYAEVIEVFAKIVESLEAENLHVPQQLTQKSALSPKHEVWMTVLENLAKYDDVDPASAQHTV